VQNRAADWHKGGGTVIVLGPARGVVNRTTTEKREEGEEGTGRKGSCTRLEGKGKKSHRQRGAHLLIKRVVLFEKRGEKK